MCNCTSGNHEIPGSMRSLSLGGASRGPGGIARNAVEIYFAGGTI